MAIKPLASGQYLVRVSSSFNGKRVEKKKVCRTKQEALFADKQFKAQLETSKNSASGVNPKNWHCCLDRYLSYAKESMSMTASYNREVCLNAVTAAWMFRDIETISVDEISFVVNNNAFKYSYKKDLLKFIKAVFEYSVASRVTNFNPCKFVKIKFEKSELSQAKVLRAMTYTETLKLLKFVKGCDENWYAIFAVTYYLGLRLSEAIELKIGDLDFERRIVTVSRSWCKKKKGSVPPKNGLSRKVSMSPTIESLLKELSKDKKTGDYVLPRVSPWITGMGAKTLNKYQDLLEIRRSNYHSLRASFITHLLNNGVPIIKVQAMVGHADLKTTQRYVRLDASDLEGATAVLG